MSSLAKQSQRKIIKLPCYTGQRTNDYEEVSNVTPEISCRYVFYALFRVKFLDKVS